ncbi:MAG: arginine--tRNA ligase [Bacteroidales bacterium]|nr:arginine--tRNA ligase [Bacteroidales bacterium]
MIENILAEKTIEAVRELYGQILEKKDVPVQKTRKDFEGDYTIVVFPFLRFSKKSPDATAEQIGQYLTANLDEVDTFNVIRGFLNLVISDRYWLDFYHHEKENSNFGMHEKNHEKPVVVEYSSPNTNKPLHLGHIRNILLGYSVSKILAAAGKNVVKVNLVNDRGIHICKSMLAWNKWGNGETPESSGMKGDHLVGKYYVLFDRFYKAEIKELIKNGMEEELAEKEASLLMEAQEMLRRWEEQNPEIKALWQMMNGWVYEGFDETYRNLGVDFDKIYYESDTYLLGREIVFEGLEKGVFYKKENDAVWCDLTSEGLDEKLLLRADGTSVYMTQDLGTAQLRHDDFEPEKLVYVVGNEQNYHFDVLKKILKKLGRNWADGIMHLSYGMVELPHGRMKSREGTVVDADDLMEEMFSTARKTTEELGKTDDFSDEEKNELFRMISLGALKYFILKVDPKKTMLFNPEESIDFNGNTGPFVQYTHARIRSLFRKAGEKGIVLDKNFIPEALHPKEKEIIRLAYDFPLIIKEAAENFSPALVANYVFDLSKEFNQIYQTLPILKDTDEQTVSFRLGMAAMVGNILKTGMDLLGVEVPERM